ncbi:MAG TPA: hypothetical protein VFR07_03130 [Mycobacteriales bacterium]|nr:hypothetical protein [Mycobacteriales bacterium]
MTAPGPTPQHDARDGDGDPAHDPAAIGEARLLSPDADGGAAPHAQEIPEPGTG